MKCDTFSSNFYQHHNFDNILLAWQNTYKLDRWPRALLAVNSLQGCRECRLRFAHFNTKGQILHARRTKTYDIIFSSVELFPLLVRFSPLKRLLCEKYTAITV